MAHAAELEWWRRGTRSELVSSVESSVNVPAGSPIAFYALIGFTVVMVLAPQQFFPVLGRLRIAFIFGVVAIVAHVFGSSKSSSSAERMPIELRMVLGLLVLGLLSIPTSYWPTGSVNTLTEQYLKSIAIFWLLGTVVCSVERLRALLWTLAVASAPVALVGLHNYLSGAFVGDRVVGYESGLASNPNDLALTLNLFIPLTAMLAVTAKRTWLRGFAWGCAGLSMVAVLISFSRGGFLTLVAESGLLVLILVRLRRTKAVAILALLASFALILTPAGYAGRLSTILDIRSDPTGSAQDRWRDNGVAVQFIAAHPIVGAGVGQGILAMNEARGTLWLQVHNAYLNYGLDLGLPGLVLFVGLVATSYRSARHVERRPLTGAGAELCAFAGGVRISMAGFMVAALFHPVPYHFYFYYIAGLVVAVKTTAARQFGVR